MPYIKRTRRIHPDNRGYHAENVGELNYAITRLCDLFLQDFGTNYANLNAVVGALECAKQELYRRVVAPYEDAKRVENGDVYGSLSETAPYARLGAVGGLIGPPPARWRPRPDARPHP